MSRRAAPRPSFPCGNCGTSLRKVRRGSIVRIVCPRCRFRMYDYPRPAAGFVVVKERSVLLLRRGHPPKRGWLDLPGGFIEPAESIERAARRELLEETGLRLGKVEYLGLYWDRYYLGGFGYFPTMNFYYIGRWRAGEPKAADDAASAEWVPIASLARLTRRVAWRHMAEVFRDLRRHTI